MNYFVGRTMSQEVDFTRMPRQAPPLPAMPTPLDLGRFVTDGLLRPLLEGLNTAATNFTDSLGSMPRASPATSTGRQSRQQPAKHHHDHGCGCRCHDDDCCCHEDPCHCNCCIVDSDLVVYARVGEVRVIPLTIENKWRRERKIKMELSPWSSRGGKPAPVQSKLEKPAPEFTLPPCGQQNIILVVNIQGAAVAGEDGKRTGDVDDCTVYYADLRLDGCDNRPIRIALAVLPRDCNTYEIECGCSCC